MTSTNLKYSSKTMRTIFLVLFLMCVLAAKAQSVKNTSYITQTGEKVLRLESVLPIDIEGAWQLFTTDAQLR